MTALAPLRPPGFWQSTWLGLGQILIWGGSFFLLTVMAEPIHADTGWSLSGIYGGLTVGVLVSAMLSPRVSHRIAQGRGRSTLASSGWIVAAGLVCLALAPNLPLFLTSWIVIGIGMAAGLYDPLFAVLGTRHGSDARQAIQTVTLIGGFASTVVWPVLAAVNHAVGWRYTCALYAALLLVSMAPIYRRAMAPDRPDMAGAHPSRPAAPPADGAGNVDADARTAPATGWADIDRTLFLLISLVFSIAAILMTVVSVQIIALLQGIGYSLEAAIAVAALIGPSMVGVRLVNLALQKVHAIWLTLFSATAVAVGLLLICMAPAAAAVGIVFYGIGNGMRALVRGMLPLALVPAHLYALAMGKLARSSLLCQALTPLVGGLLLSHAGPSALLWAMAGLAAVNVALTLALASHIRKMATVGRFQGR